jgi:endonuclease/exonuclease/phosphatase family metal-dependent hydrolase
MMSPSRRRLLLRIWLFLSVLLFAATCVDRVRPYLKTILRQGAKAADRQDVPLPSPQPKGNEARRHAGALRLASWNLQFLDVPGRGPDRRVSADYEALARQARALAADVIAVQEVASFEALALVFPAREYAFHLAQVGGAQRSGFVYRKQLKVQVHEDLRALSLSDLRAGADLGVFVQGRELRMLSVHLKAFCVTGALTRDDKDCRKLNAQVPVLEGWIDARAREGVPFVVIGDFNRALREPRDALFAELDDHEPAGLSLTQAGSRTHSACHGKKRHAVDHVLLGGDSGGWLAPTGLVEVPYAPDDLAAGRKLSDHCPIHVTLSAPAMR